MQTRKWVVILRLRWLCLCERVIVAWFITDVTAPVLRAVALGLKA